ASRQADPCSARQLCHPQTPQGARLAGAPSALDLSFHPDLGLLAQRGRELLLQDDAATHPPWRVSLDRRPADRHRYLSRRAQCQSQPLRLDPIRRGHPGQARSSSCNITLSQCTSGCLVLATASYVLIGDLDDNSCPSLRRFWRFWRFWEITASE